MLSQEERHRIYRQGYLPEHIPEYVSAISGSTPHLHHNVLCYVRQNHLLFVGYPLGDETTDIPRCYRSACRRFKPARVTIMAPHIWMSDRFCEIGPVDAYYRLDLSAVNKSSALAYMIRRAQRELRFGAGTFDDEHRRLIEAFISERDVSSAHQYIFARIADYINASETVRILEVRKASQLVAFSIIDMGSAEYAFYLFNFRFVQNPVPGASDLLFSEMVKMASREGKKAVNLGLGLNRGNRRFKEKWGGTVFVAHREVEVVRKRFYWKTILDQLK